MALPDFLGQFGSQRFVRIDQKNPVVGEGKRIHRPLTFLRASRPGSETAPPWRRMSVQSPPCRRCSANRRHIPRQPPRRDSRQRGRLLASFRAGTITLTGRDTGGAVAWIARVPLVSASRWNAVNILHRGVEAGRCSCEAGQPPLAVRSREARRPFRGEPKTWRREAARAVLWRLRRH